MSENSGKVVNLDDKRRGEIALVLLKRELNEKGLKLHKDMKRNLGNVSKDTGIPKEELEAFGKELVEEMVKKFFGSA